LIVKWTQTSAAIGNTSETFAATTFLIILSGGHATGFATEVRAGLGLTVADGMKRIGDAMTSAARSAAAGARFTEH
jgi:hypothetical protein